MILLSLYGYKDSWNAAHKAERVPLAPQLMIVLKHLFSKRQDKKLI